MKNNLWKRLLIILFYGSLWGIMEASLGYALHFLPVLVAGGILFPVAFGILFRAYQTSGHRVDMLYVGLLAALIKSVNLLMPQISIWKTINPMISIVFEALTITVAFGIIAQKKPLRTLGAISLASIGWRALYLGFMGGQYQMTGFLSVHLENWSNAILFLLIYGILSGVVATLVFGGIVALGKRWQLPWMVKASLAIPALGLAVLLTVIL